MNTLSRDKKVLILKLLVEGSSLRSVSRIADVSINTVSRLLVDAGKVCADYQDQAFRNLRSQRIQVDEIWTFVYAKAKNVPTARKPPKDAGDVWTWVALDSDSKLVPTWRLGDRSSATAIDLMDDLRARLANRVQLTSDGHRAYLEAVEGAFAGDIDYAMLKKIYGNAPQEQKQSSTRYSPGQCLGTECRRIEGQPDPAHISTSHVERQNLTMRMSMRRFTRLTNAFSKKLENHAHAIALHYMHYNFCRIHGSIRVTPAMEAKVTDRVWEISDIVRMIDQARPKPNRPKTYRQRISN